MTFINNNGNNFLKGITLNCALLSIVTDNIVNILCKSLKNVTNTDINYITRIQFLLFAILDYYYYNMVFGFNKFYLNPEYSRTINLFYQF